MNLLLGNRDPDSYFSEVTTQDHSIIAIIGGFGFLYFINEGTKSIHLIDKNHGQVSLCKMMIDLIKKSPSVSAFRGSLVCSNVDHLDNEHPVQFRGRIRFDRSDVELVVGADEHRRLVIGTDVSFAGLRGHVYSRAAHAERRQAHSRNVGRWT